MCVITLHNTTILIYRGGLSAIANTQECCLQVWEAYTIITKLPGEEFKFHRC